MKFKVTKYDLDETKTSLGTIECATFMDAVEKHKEISKEHPDSFINFVEPEGEFSGTMPSFICGQADNMKADERKLDAGLISWDQYTRKWYPQTMAEENY
jgi:hypothetical protein